MEDPGTRAHSTNESLHLATFERACLAEALLLRNLAAAELIVLRGHGREREPAAVLAKLLVKLGRTHAEVAEPDLAETAHEQPPPLAQG